MYERGEAWLNLKKTQYIHTLDYLINVTDFINLHTAMGTNRVSDQLIDYKKKLLLHKEELRAALVMSAMLLFPRSVRDC
jgi:hypothetical protein